MIKFRFNTNNTIFIIIIIILIILFLRVYNNYEGFFSELGIIKQQDSKRQETSYWTNVVQNWRAQHERYNKMKKAWAG